ncbi:acyl-CoA thioesterase [Myxococcaceae bacterium GXIMD 01537]
MTFEESVFSLRVRPNDLDSLGHVNHATVLEYLEAGRWAWMDKHGLRRVSPVIGVISRVEVDYRREILPQQELTVHTRLEVPGPEDLADEDAVHYRAVFRQQVRVGEQVVTDARVQAAFIHAAERTLASLQDFLEASRGPTHA